jgi:hypothetical protein
MSPLTEGLEGNRDEGCQEEYFLEELDTIDLLVVGRMICEMIAAFYRRLIR